MCNTCKVHLVEEALSLGPLTAKQVQKLTGMSMGAASHNLKKLKFERKAHIERWIPPTKSSKFTAVWALGFGPDAKMPVITPAMKKARRNAWQKAYRAKGCEVRNDHASVPQKPAIAPQNPFSALFF